jgi:hypothetical protein
VNGLLTVESDCTHPRAGSVRICVEDSGVGFAKEQLYLLFSEGMQFDANKLQHGVGSGFGLTIAKGVVKQHSGVIWAESGGLGRGTIFIIELPLYEFPIEEVNPQREESLTSFTSHSTDSLQADLIWRPRRILEGATSSLKMLFRLLEERAGHTCVPATNGQEAASAFTTDLAAVEAIPATFQLILFLWVLKYMCSKDPMPQDRGRWVSNVVYWTFRRYRILQGARCG